MPSLIPSPGRRAKYWSWGFNSYKYLTKQHEKLRTITLCGLNRHLWSGWQRGVAIACIFNIAVFVLSLALLIWARTKPVSDDGTYILWQGTQNSINQSDTILHLGLNAVSTGILVGTNYTLQVLVAPTRADIDKAHREKRSLDIGISSLHNWRYIFWHRKLLYVFLLALTLPVHLLYNSVIFSSIANSQQTVSFVTKDFLQIPPNNTAVDDIWHSVTSGNQWNKAAISDCMNIALWQGEYSDVLLFTNLSSSSLNGSGYCALIYTYYDAPISNTTFPSHSSLLFHLDDNTDLDFEYDASLHCKSTSSSQLPGSTYSSTNGSNFNETITIDYIEHCLLKPAYFSSVELIPQLFLVIIICSILNIAIMVLLLFSHFNPLITIGDAIASFLDFPNPFTRNMGLLSVNNLHKHTSGQNLERISPDTQGMVWKSRKRFRGSAASRLRWALTTGLCLVFLTFSATLEVWTIETQKNGSVISSSLIANIPQLALSSIYLCYNALFTCMSLSTEWMRLYRHRKGLRVSRPTGEQRGTYFLSLPYKYAVPLIMKSVALHWLLSETIFVERTDMYALNGSRIPSEHVRSVKIECFYMLPMVSMVGALLLLSIGFGLRKFDAAMPLAGSNSLIISAACHSVRNNEDLVSSEKISTKKLQYGATSRLSTGGYHVGFSDKEVLPLVPGEFYL